MPPLVSVVMIFLDAERFIREAVESVRGQTYAHWELLLVDDGSTDTSSSIAREYATLDPVRIRYLEHPGHRNRGMSASRNLGIGSARGEYIAFLDGDDVWLPGKLERQLEILRAHPEAAMVRGASLYWHGWTGAPEDAERDHVRSLGIEADRVYDPPTLLTLTLRRIALPACPSDSLVRTDVVRGIGGFEAAFRGIYDDTVFFSKIYLSWPVYVSSETWDRYRQHPDSAYAIAKRTGQRDAIRSRYLRWLAGYLSGRAPRSSDVWSALRVESRPYSLTRRAAVRTRRTLARLRSAQLLTPARWAWRQLRRAVRGPGAPPPPGTLRMGDLRRLSPISRRWGYDRGVPVDRHYVERFLQAHGREIRGRVLEVGENTYTLRFGGHRVERSDVLHAVPGNPQATLVGDLVNGSGLPGNAFDCVLLTQVLPFVPDPAAAVATIYRMLKPGGVVLATFPGIAQIDREQMDQWGDYWRFTSLSAQWLFHKAFPPAHVTVEAHGSVLTAAAFLYGLASRELTHEELEHRDPDYELVIAVRAAKP